MNPFSSNLFLPELAELLTAALIHFVWQGALLTLFLLVTVKLLDVRTARQRYLLSVGTLLMMGTAPVLTAIWHCQANSQSAHTLVGRQGASAPTIGDQTTASSIDATRPIAADMQTGSVTPLVRSVEIYVLFAWLAGVLILSTRLAIGFGVTLWVRGKATSL